MFFWLRTFDFAPRFPQLLQRIHDLQLAKEEHRFEQLLAEAQNRDGELPPGSHFEVIDGNKVICWIERVEKDGRREFVLRFGKEEMAPPHTMKGRDELEVKVMNPPLSAIINGVKNGGGDNLKDVEKMAGTLNANKDNDLEASKLTATKNENTKPITTFLEKETNVSVDKKGVAVTKAQSFWSTPQEHLPTLKRQIAGEEQGEKQRPMIEKESESVLDLSRKVEAMKLDVLSTLEMASSSTPRLSPHSTTLTPGLEVMHINSSKLGSASATTSQSHNSTVLAQGVQNMKIPITPKKPTTPATQRTPEQKHAALTANLHRMKSLSPKTSPKFSLQAAEQKLNHFFSVLAPPQKAAYNLITVSISEIERSTEALAASDSEENFSEIDTENMLKLVEANRDLVRGCWAMGWRGRVSTFMEGIREIEEILGEWERVYPDGEWDDVVVRLGNLDEVLVVEWAVMVEQFDRMAKGVAIMSDSEEGSEDADEAEEVIETSDGENGNDTVEDGDDSEEDEKDEGNESMEYIAPAEITTKGETKQDSPIPFQGQGVSKALDMPPSAVLASVAQSKPFDFSYALASTSTKSPQSASPVQATSSPPRSIPVPPHSESFDFSFNPAINTAPSSQTPATLQCPPAIFNFATASAASPQLPTSHPMSGINKRVTSPSMIFEQGLPSGSANTSSEPILNFGPANFSSPPQMSTPPFTPNLSVGSLPKIPPVPTIPPHLRETKTPSTLSALTKATQSLQTSIQSIHTALYGLDPNTLPSEAARDAGLLIMTNYIGEGLTDVQIKTSSLDAKINDIGTLLQTLAKSSDPEFIRRIHETATLGYIAALGAEHKVQRNGELLSEIKDLLVKNEKKMESEKVMLGLFEENKKLKEQLDKQNKSIEEHDVKVLRAEHAGLHRDVARLNRKLDLFVECQQGAGEREDEDLMQVLWPQGEGRLAVGGKERGILADEPGYRRREAETEVMLGNQFGRGGGRGGAGGGGWCVVM